MTISDRYRDLVAEVENLLGQLKARRGDQEAQELRMAEKALAGLEELREQVGDIPRIRLESKLTPVLLKAHGHLDRARLFLEEEGAEDRAGTVWEVEQKIYRLLNDL